MKQYDLVSPFASRIPRTDLGTVVDGPREGYYEHVFRCRNCGKKVTRYIRKGEGIEGVSFECPNCGCTVSERGVWR